LLHCLVICRWPIPWRMSEAKPMQIHEYSWRMERKIKLWW